MPSLEQSSPRLIVPRLLRRHVQLHPQMEEGGRRPPSARNVAVEMHLCRLGIDLLLGDLGELLILCLFFFECLLEEIGRIVLAQLLSP